MKKVLFFAAALFAAVACSESDADDSIVTGGDENTTTTDDQITITVSANGDAETKVSVSDSWDVEWVDGESLLAWSSDDGSLSELTMKSYTASSSTFTGAVSGETYRLVSPYIASAAVSSGSYTVDLSSQDEGINSTYMVSGSMITGDGSDQNPSMMHVGATMTLSLSFENLPEAEYTLTKVEVSDVPTTVAIDLSKEVSDDDFYGAQTSGTITVSNIDVAIAESVDVKFNILPFSVATGEGVSVTIYFEDEAGAEYSEVLSGTNSGDSVDFERATYNTLGYSCDMSEYVETPAEPDPNIENYDDTGNLISNGTFEDGTIGDWVYYNGTDGAEVVTDTYAIAGSYSLHFNGSWTNYAQAIEVEPGATYEYGFAGRHLSNAGVSGDASPTGSSARIHMTLRSVATTANTAYGDEAWVNEGVDTFASASAVIPTDVTSVYATLVITGYHGYFDNIYVKKIADAPEIEDVVLTEPTDFDLAHPNNMITNGDFEDGLYGWTDVASGDKAAYIDEVNPISDSKTLIVIANWTKIYQTIEVEAGVTYKFGCTLRRSKEEAASGQGEILGSTNGQNMTITDEDLKSNIQELKFNDEVAAQYGSTTNCDTSISATYTATETKTVAICFTGYTGGSGYLYYDNAYFEVAEDVAGSDE